MVWNSEFSPLYRTVESFNNAAAAAANEPTNTSPRTEQRDNSCETAPKAAECGCEAQEKRRPPPTSFGSAGGFLQRLTGDRDSLLIIGLIVLLMHEKADLKLIAALAFILLA